MPKVTITNKKGLVQTSGAGVTVQSATTISGLLKSTNTGGLRGAKTLRDSATSNATPTAISDALALSVNTYYTSIAANADVTIPSAAAGNIGDFISVYYSIAINDSVLHTYTTTTDTAFALGSTAVRVGGATASVGDLSVALDNVLTITGATNGDGGLGSTVRFVNMTGTTNGWAVAAVTLNQGDGSDTGTIAFS
jgi:hypothetical protein